MSKRDAATEFPKKWLDKMPEGFADSANSMSEEELKRVIVESEGNIYTIEADKDKDPKLNGAKEIMQSLGKPYREAKACQTAKIKYACFLLESRGVDLDHTEPKD